MTTVMPAGTPGDAWTGEIGERARSRSRGSAARPDGREQAAIPTGPTTLTDKLTGTSMECLARAARVSRSNLTDTVNRAVQLYDLLVTVLAENKRNALVIMRDGQAEEIRLD